MSPDLLLLLGIAIVFSFREGELFRKSHLFQVGAYNRLALPGL